MSLSNLVHSEAEPRSCQETQEFKIPTRKFRNPGFLTGNSRFFTKSNAEMQAIRARSASVMILRVNQPIQT